MGIRHSIRKCLQKIGYDIVPYTARHHPIARRKKLMESFQINVLLDVGATTREWALSVRNEIGFSGRIVSFEPLKSAYELLEMKAKDDPLWKTMNYALGEKETKMEINISANSVSSSFLEMVPSHLEAAPHSGYVGNELVEVKSLDSLFDDICSIDDNIYLKIDTQGFEEYIIKGAEKSLSHIGTIQMEMSLVPVYKGQELFHNICFLMIGKGYDLVSIETGFSNNNSGQILQVDGIFHRFQSFKE